MPWSTPAGSAGAACWAACSGDMLFATVGQASIFLWMLAAGMLIGAWYALLAGLRRLLCAGVWLGLMCDLAFGLGAALLFCLALYAANYGALRLYAALAALMGFGLFALGAFPMGKGLINTIKCAKRTLFVIFNRFCWIKVIFK